MDRPTKAFKSYKGVALLISEKVSLYMLIGLYIHNNRSHFLAAKLLIILEMSAIDSEIFIKNLLCVRDRSRKAEISSFVYDSPAAVPKRRKHQETPETESEKLS